MHQTLKRDADSLLSTVAACRNKTYARRGLFLREVDARNRASLATPVVTRSYEDICGAEYRVLTGFWADYAQYMRCFKSTVTPEFLTSHFFLIWYLFEGLLSTVAHGHLESSWCFLDRTTVFRVEYGWAVNYYRAMPWLRDPEPLALLTIEDCERGLHLARIIRRAALDEQEHVVLLQLLIAYYEKDLFVDATSHKSFVNQTLRELHKHHQSTYSNYAERLGTLTAILGDVHRLVLTNKELLTSIAVYCSDDPIQNQGTDPHDLRRRRLI